jgi:PAS domain S-box-containing protein
LYPAFYGRVCGARPCAQTINIIYIQQCPVRKLLKGLQLKQFKDNRVNFYIKRSCSLKTKLTIFIFAALLVNVWSLALYASRLLREDMEHLAGEQQLSTVSYMAAEINEALETRLKSLEKIASQITPHMLDHPASLQALLEQRPLLQILFNGGVFATGIDGTAIADVPLSTGRIGMNYMDRTAISGPIKEGKSMIGRPAMGKKLAAPIFSLTAPIRDAQGKVIGVLAGTINLNLPSFLDRLTSNRYGKTGGYLLVAPQYRLVVTATDKRRTMTPASPPGANKLIDAFMQGYEGSGVLVNSLGMEVLTSAKRIPVAGWYVAASLPTEEAFAPIYTMQNRILFAALFLTLIASVLTWLLLRRLLSPMIATITTIGAMTATDLPPQPLAIVRDDEIGQLIGGFNRLLKTLAQREENLVRSEEKRRSILYTAMEGYYLLDYEGRFLEVNDAFCRMSGYTERELSAMRITDVGVINTTTGTAAHINKLLRQGDERFETRYRRKDGSIIDVEVSVHCQQYDGGRSIAFLHDITDRKLAEHELKMRTEWLICIFNATNEVIIIYDTLTKTINDVNERIFQVLGYSRNEVLSLKAGSLLSNVEPYTEKNAENVFSKVVTEGPLQLECQFRRKDGSFSWTTTSLSSVSIDGKDFIIAVVRDNNARKHAEAALADSEVRYRRLFEVESDALLMVDHESGRFMDANTAAVRMYGYSIEEILQMKHSDVSAEPYQTGQAVEKLVTEVPIRWHRKKDGTIFPVEIAGSYFTYKDRKVHVAAIRDITKRMQKDDELKQALEASQAVNKTMQRLLNVIAHEFRTPLGLLTGCTDILDRYWDSLTPEKRFEQNENIRSAARQISNLVNSVISFNQLKNTRFNNSPQPVDIAETCRSIAAETKTVWSTGQKLDVTRVEDCGTALLDENLFRHALENLLTNAFRYTPSDGTVSLLVLRKNDRLVIEISDTGIGIPEEDLKQIFNAFYRGANIEGRRGLGLGLSIVSDVLSHMSGVITVISKPHEGTTMHVEIPVDDQA